MAITYTLEEAAAKLGVPPDEFRRKLKTEWTHLRPMRDGNTLRFKEKEIEELARQTGIESVEVRKPSKKPGTDVLPILDDSSSEIQLPDDSSSVTGDVFRVAGEPIPVVPQPKVKSGSDSDVRLEKSGKHKKPAKKKKPERDGTDEIELDVLPPSTSPSGKSPSSGSGKKSGTSSGRLGAGGKSGKLPSTPEESESSEFELTLDPDSSDEFELSLGTDSSSSEEISLGDDPELSGAKGGASGINIGRPADSGINLERKGDSDKRKKGDSGTGKKSDKKLPSAKKSNDSSEEEIDFEIKLDQPGASSKKIGSGISKKKTDSDSEFELTLDDVSDSSEVDAATGAAKGRDDIFETDFEIPALDDESGSEAVEASDTDLDSSDFDLAIDDSDSSVIVAEESASQVVAIDEEEEPAKPAKKKPAKAVPAKAKAKKKKAVDDEDEEAVADDEVSLDEMELDEGVSASKALKGASAQDEDEDEAEKQAVVVSQAAQWGAMPALVMFPTVFLIFLGGLMAYELTRSAWGYHQPTKPSTLIIDHVAKALDLQPKQ